MAEEAGKGTHVSSRTQFELWLEKRKPPKELCVALAARAALRSLPFVFFRVLNTKGAAENATLVVTAFRATALARVAAKYPTLANMLRSAAQVASFDPTTPRSAAFAADAARAASASNAAQDALKAADFAARAAAAVVSDGERSLWEALSADLQLVDQGVSSHDLVDRPLWISQGTPYSVLNSGYLKARLPENQNWSVWLDWYDRRHYVGSDHEELELIFATVPEQKWAEGPAAANAWIAERLKALDERVTSSAASSNGLPRPLDGVPSLFEFGENEAGQIDLVSGPQNIPAINFPGDIDTHHDWLDVARELARRLIDDLKAGKYGNLRHDYCEGLQRYASDLPAKPGEGNFMLADAEIIALLDLLGAEASILPDAFSARLNRVLSGHFALLDFYPVARRYHEAARKGRLSPPLPQGAFAGFANVVQKNSPSTFAPRVTQGLAEAAREPPKVELDEADRAIHAAITPAKYPYDYDSDVERRFGKAGTVNALYKTVLDRVKDPEKAEAMLNIAKDLSPYAREIVEWLQKVISG